MVDFHTSLAAALVRPAAAVSTEELLRALEEHVYELGTKPLRFCSCGFWFAADPERGETMQEIHRKHLAEVLTGPANAAAHGAWVRGQYAGRDYERRLARWERLADLERPSDLGPKPDAPTNPYEARPV